MTEISEITASIIVNRIEKELNWLDSVQNIDEIVDNCKIDGEIQSLNFAIHLKNNKHHHQALRLLEKISECYPLGDIGYFESGMNAAMLLQYDRAIGFAKKAVSLNGSRFNNKSLLCRLYAVTGKIDNARDVINTFSSLNPDHRRHIVELAQFIDYCEQFPVKIAYDALKNLQQSGAYLEAGGVANEILTAVGVMRPYSFVRLGDGEGSWLILDNYDEGKYISLYRANRKSFLLDWFGSEDLIYNDLFYDFCYNLNTNFTKHDIIGIPPEARIDQESSFLSIRGIPSSVNVFRFIRERGLKGQKLFCSNSVNLNLAHETSFYSDLFRMDRKFSVISSQSHLVDILKNIGVKIANFHHVPGDSRNFHLDASLRPICQFPEYLSRTESAILQEDLKGTVYLVAAGFVGKKYISTIKDLGGIAIDLGSLADHWSKHGIN